LLLAFGVAVYAIWRGGKTPNENSRPAQVAPSPVPQNAAPSPAPATGAPAALGTPAAQASPDAQGGAMTSGMPGAAYLAPTPAGQPYYVAPGASSPGQAGLPSVPTVISESDPQPSPEDASRSKRRNDGGARDAASGAQPAGRRDDAGRDAGARSDASSRDARTPGSESQSAPPARQTQPPAQPSTTPERGKVIQWPPQ
jgi:hypothetical protein